MAINHLKFRQRRNAIGHRAGLTKLGKVPRAYQDEGAYKGKKMIEKGFTKEKNDEKGANEVKMKGIVLFTYLVLLSFPIFAINLSQFVT